jgi:hypothetical protein
MTKYSLELKLQVVLAYLEGVDVRLGAPRERFAEHEREWM